MLEKNRTKSLHATKPVNYQNIGMMKVKYDKEVDIMVLEFALGDIAESDEVNPGMIFDYDIAGNLLRVEILDASTKNISPNKVEYEVVG
ncbi:MAG: hypothetical protein ACI82Q_002864 [Nonlabens sp.]|jgi:uncharacterized protein YuzE